MVPTGDLLFAASPMNTTQEGVRTKYDRLGVKQKVGRHSFLWTVKTVNKHVETTAQRVGKVQTRDYIHIEHVLDTFGFDFTPVMSSLNHHVYILNPWISFVDLSYQLFSGFN